MSRPAELDRNHDATCYIGNLDDRSTEALVWELMIQAGPLVNLHLPKDRISQQHQGYGFAEFQTEQDADYACKVMNGLKLFGKPIRVNKASNDKKQIDIGANLFVGNLDANVDERTLYETFATFGNIVGLPKVARDPSSGVSKNFAFVSFDSFEAADAAIESLNNQFLLNRPITVSYAIKKDSKTGERHGTPAERLLAAQARKNNALPVPAPRPSGLYTSTVPLLPPSHHHQQQEQQQLQRPPSGLPLQQQQQQPHQSLPLAPPLAPSGTPWSYAAGAIHSQPHPQGHPQGIIPIPNMATPPTLLPNGQIAMPPPPSNGQTRQW